MMEFQLVSVSKLRKMLEQRSIWSRMHSGKLLAVEQNSTPSKVSDGGTSYIISYYDEHHQYVCTIHRIVTKEGKTIHEHPKDAYIDGVRYNTKLIRRGKKNA